ncbi:MAG: HD domain-containing protein [bacterium]
MLTRGRAWDSLDKEQAVETTPASETIDREACLKAAQRLGKRMQFEIGHSLQVTRLALSLFDHLEDAHGFGAHERFLLEMAAVLHDIGISEGLRKHHKSSFRLIQAADLRPLPDHDKLLISLIARFHRKAEPSQKIEDFAALAPDDQRLVEILAGILRVADGLDSTHLELVRSISIEVTTDSIILNCEVSGDASSEREATLNKGTLFQKVMGKKLEILFPGLRRRT